MQFNKYFCVSNYPSQDKRYTARAALFLSKLLVVVSFPFKMEFDDTNLEEECKEMDLSCLELRTIDVDILRITYKFRPELLRKLVLCGNNLNVLPSSIAQFSNLYELDVSCNEISWLSGEISQLNYLEVLELRNNRLSNLPKNIENCSSLKILNLSGNLYTDFPQHLFELQGLQELYLGGNEIVVVPPVIQRMKSLEILYLGGNQIKEVPPLLAKLKNLRHLFLCDNQLKAIPREFGQLKCLESLSLHKNELTTLPVELVMLVNLQELTLRDNPLVNTFIQKLEFSPPSLLELCGRILKKENIQYENDFLPWRLNQYLNSAKCCVNPKCDGVYFDSRVKCVKFVDFCGKYRLPLEQYLCSPNEQECCPSLESADAKILRKVLLPGSVVDSD